MYPTQTITFTPEVQARLHAVYPHGFFELMDDEQLNHDMAKAFDRALDHDKLASMGFTSEGVEFWMGDACAKRAECYFESQDNLNPAHLWSGHKAPESKKKAIEHLRNTQTPMASVTVYISHILPLMLINVYEYHFNPETWDTDHRDAYNAGYTMVANLENTDYEPWASLIKYLVEVAQSINLPICSANQLLTVPVESIQYSWWNLDKTPEEEAAFEEKFDKMLDLKEGPVPDYPPQVKAFYQSFETSTCDLLDCLFCWEYGAI